MDNDLDKKTLKSVKNICDITYESIKALVAEDLPPELFTAASAQMYATSMDAIELIVEASLATKH